VDQMRCAGEGPKVLWTQDQGAKVQKELGASRWKCFWHISPGWVTHSLSLA
jgi:hypothetical protein